MTHPDPTFPPLLTGRVAIDPPDPFACAGEAAARGDAAAGHVFWLPGEETMQLAVVLEPEVPATRATQMHFAMLVAVGDALGALGPPETAVFYRWPDTILVNGAVAGRVRLALPEEAGPEDVPDWLVVGLEMVLLRPADAPEPGDEADRTTLAEEGLGDIGASLLIESVCRHFLVWIHHWTDDGFRPIHDSWMARMEDRGGDTTIVHDGTPHTGRVLGLDEEGNLMLQTDDGVAVLPFAPVVARRAGAGPS